MGLLPRRLVWNTRTHHVDELYCGSYPLVIFMPVAVTYISYYEDEPGVYHLRLGVRPLGPLDLIGLLQITTLVFPESGAYILALFIN